MKKLTGKVLNFIYRAGQNQTGAFAAQSAYFFMLSMIPVILLLLTIVQYTPVTKADVMTAVVMVFPEDSMQSLMVSIVNQVYNQSRSIIPVTALVALWSAGKGVLAISTGLNWIYHCQETRDYIRLRLRASLYTIIFILSIVLGLVLSVYGNSISLFVTSRFPILEETMESILQMRTVLSFILLLGFSLLIYRFLPNRKDRIRNQLPGAVFTSIGWLVISFIFSMYLTVFTGFSVLYGSIANIILIMLWLYFCMYVMLLGGLVNVVYKEEMEKRKGDTDDTGSNRGR